jgi:hypothetical protein
MPVPLYYVPVGNNNLFALDGMHTIIDVDLISIPMGQVGSTQAEIMHSRAPKVFLHQ